MSDTNYQKETTMDYDWTPLEKDDPRRDPWKALRSKRELTPEVLAECARRAPGAALESKRELPPEIRAWCESAI